MLEVFVTIVHVLVALFMILVVLVQGGNQGGMGAAFGGGNSAGVFGATGATTLLGKLTYGAAAVFMITSVTLTVMRGAGGESGLSEELRKAAAAEQGTAPATTEGTPATGETPQGDVAPADQGAVEEPAAGEAADESGAASMSAPVEEADEAPGAAENEEVTP